MPWLVVLGGLFAVLLVAGTTWAQHPVADVYDQLTGGGQIIAYGTPYFVGGLAAYGVSRVSDRYRGRSPGGSGADV